MTALAGRVALVTGASRGIGRACAAALASAGAHVVAVARTQGGLEDLDDELRANGLEGATLVPLDICDGEGLDTLGRALFDRFGRLDVLVSAAGDLGLITPVAHLDPATWDRALAVNLTAAYRLIRSMDVLLQASTAGRAIFMTSGAARSPRAFWGPYATAKAGLEMLVGCYGDEVAHTQVRCVLVNPGPMRTRMRAAAFPGEDPETLTAPEAIGPMIVSLARPDHEPPRGVLNFADWTRAN